MKLKDIVGDVIKILNASTVEKKKKDETENGESGVANKAAKDGMFERLEKIDEEYKNKPDRTYGGTVVPVLKEKTYEALSDDEIKKKAESEYADLTNLRREELKRQSEDKKKAYADRKDDLAEDVKAEETRVKAAYAAAKENAANEAIKRGIARSSIVSEQLKELDEAEIGDVGELYKAARASVAAVDEKIAGLSDELNDALEKLDVETAVKINKRIRELEDERREREEETLEYNNGLKEERAKLLTSLGKSGVKVKEENSQEYIDARSDKLRELYNYYKGVGDDVVAELEEDRARIENYVGADGYAYLKRALSK